MALASPSPSSSTGPPSRARSPYDPTASTTTGSSSTLPTPSPAGGSHRRDASGSTLGRTATTSSRKPSEASTSGTTSSGRRKVRTEPPFAARQPPTPPDSPGLVPSHLFAAGADVERQQLPPLQGSSSELELAGVEEEDAAATSAGGRRPSWWANSTTSFRGKFAGSGSSSATILPGEGARSYFPSILGGGGGSHTPNILAEGRETASPSAGSDIADLPPSPAPSVYATPTRPRRASHRPNFRLSLPTPTQSFAAYTAHQSKTPGWAEPYSASFPSRRAAHGRSLSRARGDHLTDKERAGAGSVAGDGSLRGGIKARIQRWTLYSFWTPLFVRLANVALTCTTLGLGVRIRKLESAADLSGITGPSPLVAIIYSPPTLLHVLSAVYLEYFGMPIGLWSLPSKLLFTSLDLVVICLWASLLSLTMSDIFTSPLHCAPESSRWWTNVKPSAAAAHVDGVCASQVAMTVSVVVGVVGFLVGNVVSLAHVWARMVDRSGGGLRTHLGFGGKR